MSDIRPDVDSLFTFNENTKEELADAGKMYLVSDQQLRRLLRYSTVMTFHDCRTIEVPAPMVDLIIEKE
jgi:hypothetical protein